MQTVNAMSDRAPGARRSHCNGCTRPLNACICGWVTPVATGVELLVLQHPMEAAHAKGSARLLHMSVPGSRLVKGERFDPCELDTMLYGGGRRPVLLYPDPQDERAPGVPAPAPFGARLAAPASLRLVVLDGTWRKSRKMLHLNPLLQQLPRLPLTAMPASHYLIRKAHAPDQLSTLEATCYALGQLEGDAARFAPLVAAFDRFVAHFGATAGRIGISQD